MALDVQRNWDVSMADNLKSIKAKSTTRLEKRDLTTASIPIPAYYTSNANSVYLPDEIILQIVDYLRRLEDAQYTLYACTRLSRQWYRIAVPFLYRHPDLEGNRFDPFIRAICPSINLHVKEAPLARLVRILDMGRLVHQSSHRITARLLGRVKENLEEFVAPQFSFALNSFPALAKCRKLKRLDLSLVTDIGSLQTLFNTLRGMPDLVELQLPRSSGFGTRVSPGEVVWPPRLKRLFLSGALDANFLQGIVQLPKTLEELTIEHLPLAKGSAVRMLLETIALEGVPLKYLKLSNMPRLSDTSLDNTLALLPNLETLSISVDYITSNFIDTDFQNLRPGDLKLRALELTNSGNPGVEDKLSPIDIIIAMDDEVMPLLRQVRVAKSLGWRLPSTAEDFDALDDALQTAAVKQDAEVEPSEEIKRIRPGAWELM